MKHNATAYRVFSRCGCSLGAVAVALVSFHQSSSSADTTRTVREIVPGITLSQEITTGDHPLIVHYLRVDLNTKTVHVRSGQAMDAITLSGPSKGREPLHLLANRDGAVCGVNADYFPFTGDPLGLEVRDGELLSEPMEYRACLGLAGRSVQMAVLTHYGALDLADSTSMILSGINRVPQPGEIVALCPAFAASPRMTYPACVTVLSDVNLPVSVSKPMRGVIASVTELTAGASMPACPPGCVLLVGSGKAAGDLSAHCIPGATAKFRFDLVANSPAAQRGSYASRSALVRGAFQSVWQDVTEAVGGGPWLVRNGKVDVDWEIERLNKVTFVERRHPRTAVGFTADNVLLMVAVDGRSDISQGASLDELAAIMKGLGSVNAINLDGGGSTTMVVEGSVVNAPTDGRERPIADSLLVYSDIKPADSPIIEPAQRDPAIVVHAGESIPIKAPAATLQSANPSDLLWGTEDGLGFVSQRGVFTSTHAGSGSVLVHGYGGSAPISVNVIPADPSVIRAVMTAIADYPPYYAQISVTVTDRFGNPIQGVKLGAELAGGQLESPLITGANGQTTGQIVWDVAPEKRLVKITALNLKPLFVKMTSTPVKANSTQDPDDR